MITVDFYGLLLLPKQFFDYVPPKVGRSSVEEVFELVFEALIFVENNTPKMVRQE